YRRREAGLMQKINAESERRKAELDERQEAIEKNQRSHFSDKEKDLEMQYRERLAAEQTRFQVKLDEANDRADETAKHQKKLGEPERKALQAKKEKIRGALKEEFRAKERDLTSQMSAQERSVYDQAREKERVLEEENRQLKEQLAVPAPSAPTPAEGTSQET